MLFFRSRSYLVSRTTHGIRMHRVIMVVGKPLLIVRERGEASFKRPKLENLGGVARCFRQVGVFGRF